jgi:hypothetical protein
MLKSGMASREFAIWFHLANMKRLKEQIRELHERVRV